MLDYHDMLSCKSLSKAHRKRLRARACGVAIALVGAMSFGASPAENGSLDAIEPKAYIRSILDKPQALCLIKLYGKESAFNRYAIGNIEGKKQAYGIPQLKNPEVGLMNAVQQIDAGIDYIRQRSQYKGDMCKAWKHWQQKGWH
jgi:hypothetical protein